MQHHLYVLVPAIASIFLTSCATYQYVTVSSDLPTTDDVGYIIETDSIAVSYSFNGHNGPVKVSVRNKLDIPLYIDWKRSALILNDETNTYFEDRARFEGRAEGHTVQVSPTFSTTTSTVHGEIRREESVGFVAPHSAKNSSWAQVDSKFFKFEGSRKEHLVKIQTAKGPEKAFRYSFGKQNTPLHFRTYLTLAYDPDFTRPVAFDHEFWVSQVVETRLSRSEYPLDENEYFKRDFHGVGAIITLGAVATLGLILIPVVAFMNSAP